MDRLRTPVDVVLIAYGCGFGTCFLALPAWEEIVLSRAGGEATTAVAIVLGRVGARGVSGSRRAGSKFGFTAKISVQRFPAPSDRISSSKDWGV